MTRQKGTIYHLEHLRFIQHRRSLDISLSEIRRLLAFAAAPSQSCSQVDDLLDKHRAHVCQRLKALRDSDRQLVELQARRDGDSANNVRRFTLGRSSGPAEASGYSDRIDGTRQSGDTIQQ